MSKADQAVIDLAKKRFQQAQDAFRENRERMLEDLAFSNPADPQQWEPRAREIRTNGPDGARPCLTLDQTNPYIAQVVNDGRQNKPGLTCMPSSAGSRQQVAEAIEGMFRYIEYQSRAQIAYDTALEYAARVGLGWIRVMPEMIDERLNFQDIRIKRIHDPLSVLCDPDWSEPDGSDIQWGFVETQITKDAFKAQYPDADPQTWDTENISSGWMSDNSLRMVEYFELVKTPTNKLHVTLDGVQQATISEEEYWRRAKETGQPPQVLAQYTEQVASVKWRKMTGCEILEESEFPSCYIPLIPVLGDEIWVEGKRYLCGMVRKMRQAQMAYNYERSAWVEAVALQPKAPYVAAWESIQNHATQWGAANRSNMAYLPYDHLDESGNPLPAPQRLSPPQMPAAFAQGAQFAHQDLQASIGMFQANIGAPTSEHSGIAIRAKQREGDTANFHYIDNLSRSIEHVGRIVVDMLPRLYDEKREARILGQDGSAQIVMIDPSGEPYSELADGAKTINLGTGVYDVRVKVGPAYTSLREEASEHLAQIMQGNPAMAAVVAPIWARMQDWPEADKLAKALLAMAPPQVQAALSEGAAEDVDGLKKKLQEQEQQLQQMHQMIDAASQKLEALQAEDKKTTLEYLATAAKIENDLYGKETDRIKALQTGMTMEQVQALVMQTLRQAASTNPEGSEDLEQAITLGPQAYTSAEMAEPEHMESPEMSQEMPQMGEMPGQE